MSSSDNDVIYPILHDENDPPVGITPDTSGTPVGRMPDPPVGRIPEPLGYYAQKAKEQKQRKEQEQLLEQQKQQEQEQLLKQQLCEKLFGRSNNGCFELTMRQLDTLEWARIHDIYDRTGIGVITYEKIHPIADYFEEVRNAMGCLLEIAKKGLFIPGRLGPIDEFKRVYSIVLVLFGSKTPESNEKYKKMLTIKESLSDESFTTNWGNGSDRRREIILEADRAFDFVYMFFPELHPSYGHISPDLYNIRDRMIAMYDCLISIMLQSHPQLKTGGHGIRKLKSYKKKRSIRNTKRKSNKKHKKSYKK